MNPLILALLEQIVVGWYGRFGYEDNGDEPWDGEYILYMPIGYNDIRSANLDTLISKSHRFLKKEELI